MTDNKTTINKIKEQLDEVEQRNNIALSDFLRNDPMTFSQWSEQSGIPVTTLHTRVSRQLERKPELKVHVMDINSVLQVDAYLREIVTQPPKNKVLLSDYCKQNGISLSKKKRMLSDLERIKAENPTYYAQNVEVFNHKKYVNPHMLSAPKIAQQLHISEDEFDGSFTLTEVCEELEEELGEVVSVEDVEMILKKTKVNLPDLYKRNYYGYFLCEHYISSMLRDILKNSYLSNPTFVDSDCEFFLMSDGARRIGLEPLYVQAKVRQLKNEDPDFFEEHAQIDLHQCYIDEEFLERIDRLNDTESESDPDMYTFRMLLNRLKISKEDEIKFSRWLQHLKNTRNDLFSVDDRHVMVGHRAYFSLGLVDMIEEAWLRRGDPYSYLQDSAPID